MTIRRFTFIATTLAIVLAASTATASQQAPGPNHKAAIAAKRYKHQKFPMQAKRFQKLLRKRIKRTRVKINRILVKRRAPKAVAKKVNAQLAKNVQQLLKAAKKASADGVVSKVEARCLRKLAKRLMKVSRKKLNARLQRSKRYRGKGNKDGSTRFNPANPWNR